MLSIAILVFYFIVIAVYLLISFFIVYHIVRYSISQDFRIVTLSLFVLVSTGLLLSNLALFFSINWNGILATLTF
jgi:hypothetical protein